MNVHLRAVLLCVALLAPVAARSGEPGTCLPCHQAPAKSTLYPCSGRPGKALCVLDIEPATPGSAATPR